MSLQVACTFHSRQLSLVETDHLFDNDIIEKAPSRRLTDVIETKNTKPLKIPDHHQQPWLHVPVYHLLSQRQTTFQRRNSRIHLGANTTHEYVNTFSTAPEKWMKGKTKIVWFDHFTSVFARWWLYRRSVTDSTPHQWTDPGSLEPVFPSGHPSKY